MFLSGVDSGPFACRLASENALRQCFIAYYDITKQEKKKYPVNASACPS